ncbi:hypothetical protein GQX74_014773 [Glossina fuscipes]|nr:hypothetical protein GQX74_014773 [Glossina fuscipes]
MDVDECCTGINQLENILEKYIKPFGRILLSSDPSLHVFLLFRCQVHDKITENNFEGVVVVDLLIKKQNEKEKLCYEQSNRDLENFILMIKIYDQNKRNIDLNPGRDTAMMKDHLETLINKIYQDIDGKSEGLSRRRLTSVRSSGDSNSSSSSSSSSSGSSSG